MFILALIIRFALQKYILFRIPQRFFSNNVRIRTGMRNTYGPDMVQRWVNGFTVSAMSMAMSLTSNTKEKIGQRNYLYYMNTSDEVMNENVMSQLDAELDHAGEETALSPQMLLLEQLRITPEKELSKMDFLLGRGSLQAKRTSSSALPVSEEGLSQRGRRALRRGPEDGPAPLQDLRPQDTGELGGLVSVMPSLLEHYRTYDQS